MKALFTSLIVLLFSFILSAQETFTLKVTVNNASVDEGKMVYSLNTENQFMKAAPLQTASIEIKDGVATAIFENVPAGAYAVIVLHDKNANEKMDFSANGMPQEAYGTSNNPMSYGPPTWADAKFALDSDKEIIVRL
ncbi:hypothetical protein CW736_08900 [Nonlabens sp. MB-3u-79]|jgi:uncharacterized protein (DUF2141 family)|uniref:DUF2141 domain-containing protein n=1 Tax=Nonlabens sp. MB-3u-79 TaxID=2058134 RepID=UPI000C31332A|nr:DUF2141 domain-containing protein [Nonlabens sp. MB-3u-79]AUC79484.1 hypothetical protein CW736_08900 [Nonlabens sp. MB-3u-79]|tara:strand:- start:13867 stop:14277 length:411 start_codon:yes stop_codon:yes gene_type:complete